MNLFAMQGLMKGKLGLNWKISLIGWKRRKVGVWFVIWNYYDYLLSKARRKFGDKVLASKLQCGHRQLSSFPLVTKSTAVHHLSHCLQFCALCCQYDVKGQQVAGASSPWQQCDINVKTWWPNFVVPYSTNNHSRMSKGTHVQSTLTLNVNVNPQFNHLCWELNLTVCGWKWIQLYIDIVFTFWLWFMLLWTTYSTGYW